MTITQKNKQDYLKDLTQRHPDIVKLEQVKVLGNKHQIVPIIKFIIQIIKQSKNLTNLDQVGLDPRGQSNLDGEDWQERSSSDNSKVPKCFLNHISNVLYAILTSTSMLVDGGMHAREWVTIATAISLIGHLVRIFLVYFRKTKV